MGQGLKKLLLLLEDNIITQKLWDIVQNMFDNLIFLQSKIQVLHKQLFSMFMFQDFTAYNYE